MATLLKPEDYHSHFDPKIYLEMLYKYVKKQDDESRIVSPFIRAFHEFWSTFDAPTDTQQGNVRYLEFGGGPSIASHVFACPKVDHIVFSEYTKANREAVKSWIAGDLDAHDWMPFIRMAVLELERGADESSVVLTDKEKLGQVQSRVDDLKRKIKSVIPCDVFKTPIVELESDDVGKPFDVVSTSVCLESCVTSEAQYKNIVVELCKLLKPNGHLFMNGVLEGTFYIIGNNKFYNFPLTEKMVKEAMNEAGIEIEKFTALEAPPHHPELCDATALFYTYGRKSAGN